MSKAVIGEILEKDLVKQCVRQISKAMNITKRLILEV